MSDVPELTKQDRLDAPTGWLALTSDETLQFVIDALLSAGPAVEFTTDELARYSGVDADAVPGHVERLVALGIVAESADGRRYRLADDSEPGRLVADLNAALADRRPGLDGEPAATGPSSEAAGSDDGSESDVGSGGIPTDQNEAMREAVEKLEERMAQESEDLAEQLETVLREFSIPEETSDDADGPTDTESHES